MNNSVSDEQLYNDFLHGDNEALDELLVRYKDGLTWFLYGIVRNMEDAEDLMMDTFALLITKRLNFRNDSTFKTWLYGVGRNLARKHLRKSHCVNGHELVIVPEIYKEVIGSGDLLEDIIISEDVDQLYSALHSIPEEYATVLYLQYIEQLNTKQVARVMKKTVKQIYNLTARAKVQMKKEIELIKGKEG